jgi:hypothetical protein
VPTFGAPKKERKEKKKKRTSNSSIPRARTELTKVSDTRSVKYAMSACRRALGMLQAFSG